MDFGALRMMTLLAVICICRIPSTAASRAVLQTFPSPPPPYVGGLFSNPSPPPLGET